MLSQVDSRIFGRETRLWSDTKSPGRCVITWGTTALKDNAPHRYFATQPPSIKACWGHAIATYLSQQMNEGNAGRTSSNERSKPSLPLSSVSATRPESRTLKLKQGIRPMKNTITFSTLPCLGLKLCSFLSLAWSHMATPQANLPSHTASFEARLTEYPAWL